MLNRAFLSWFDGGTRSRGEQYFRQGRVARFEWDESSIRAEVRGTERYNVRVEFDVSDKSWDVLTSCDCPIGSDYSLCKHVWATLLAAEAEGMGETLGPTPRRVMVSSVDSDDFSDSESRTRNGRGVQTKGAGTVLKSAPTSDIVAALSRLGVKTGADLRLAGSAAKVVVPPRPKPPEVPGWLRQMRKVRPGYDDRVRPPALNITPLYVLELESMREQCKPAISILHQPPPKKPGAAPPRPKRVELTVHQLSGLPSELDVQLCAAIIGCEQSEYGWYSYGRGERHIAGAMFLRLLPGLVATDRFFTRANRDAPLTPVSVDTGEPWRLVFSLRPTDRAGQYDLMPMLKRAEERRPVSDFDLVTHEDPAVCVKGGMIARVEAGGQIAWLREAVTWKPQRIGIKELGSLASELLKRGDFPPLDTPDGCELREIPSAPPRPRLRLSAKPTSTAQDFLEAAVEFAYGEQTIEPTDARPCLRGETEMTLLRRDRAFEEVSLNRILELGARRNPYNGRLSVPAKKMVPVVGTLLMEGWTVLGGQHLFRTAGQVKIEASTGIDWFEVNGQVDFDDQSVGLPVLLEALRKGEKFVVLGDGSMGMLPEQWLARNRGWLGMGQQQDGKLRFARTQIGLIDALLAELPEASCDEQLHTARRRLASFEGIKPKMEPEGFCGELRGYQREGLGWLGFLNEFGFGGCLADDMGLGKTVQLLAHIADAHSRGENGPWLVVAPKSLMFNWEREAARFAPSLRVIRSTGVERAKEHGAVAGADLVLTTYGTLRKDAAWLRKVEFAGVVLDEAQAIKNPDSQSAKAARLLNARRRLALTGTPVENHVGDLWSIFDFLNPGMLGTLTAFRGAYTTGGSGGAGGQDDESRKQSLALLSCAVRPFILRRTKEKVAPELPKRIEETILCQLPAGQRKLYNELRDHYRKVLLGKVDKAGLNRSKIHVLEALLRLRQAACHPGLIDPRYSDAESAKLESLSSMLDEAVDSGHRALVFSQFTSMLALVRHALDAQKIGYEYLDGQTKEQDRAAAVDRFQRGDGNKVFLISLKAGGFGLNLTAADYVFILDPWWNPAVEAQAIDRAHRIGQDKRVIAYRLIAEDTVESHIVELQKQKRALADAIVGEQESLIASLTREDLAALLA